MLVLRQSLVGGVVADCDCQTIERTTATFGSQRGLAQTLHASI
jgi:hypothetical protein